MKIGLLGGEGQVGTELLRLAQREQLTVAAPRLDELDITQPDAVHAWVRAGEFDVVINCAAYTAVDAAEGDRDVAFAVNRDGAANVAEACAEADAETVLVSTDYVFDGTKSAPYSEADVPNPTSVYGASKLAGEEAAQAAHARVVVLRVSWVFSAHGNNFVKTMLRLAQERDELRVVDDQVGAPCGAISVADALVRIARRLTQPDAPTGVYHFASQPYVSWFEFAKAIVGAVGDRLAGDVTVTPITTEEFPTAARRPANSRLQPDRLKEVFGIDRADWRRDLDATLRELVGPPGLEPGTNRL